MAPTPDILLKVDIRGALRDLVPFVQFIKREKHPWRSVNFSKVSGFNLQDACCFFINQAYFLQKIIHFGTGS